MGKKYTLFKVNLDGLEEKARWYTIVTQYNYEQKVLNDINRMIIDTNLSSSMEEAFCGIKEEDYVFTNSKGEKKIKTKNIKVMANYVFIKTKMTADIWAVLTNITGVSAILCTAGIPVFTSETKIKEIKEMLGVE
jgi:transcription antitermination factor NusG